MKRLLRKIFYRLSPEGRMRLRRLYYLPSDLWDRMVGKRHPLSPPKGMIYTGSGDFIAQGKQFCEYFETYAGLSASSRILDIGSGIGRMAIPLTGVLQAEKGGYYEGFDVVKSGVDWCKKNIHSRFPHFRFTYIPLRNDLYREDGDLASNFEFPYPDDHFDLVILTSVFTHMVPDEVVHYLEEIHRTLRNGGKVFATFFIWNKGEQHSHSGQGFTFPHDMGHYRLMDLKVESANVAYSKEWLLGQIENAGLKCEQLHYGNWYPRPDVETLDFQDILILSK